MSQQVFRRTQRDDQLQEDPLRARAERDLHMPDQAAVGARGTGHGSSEPSASTDDRFAAFEVERVHLQWTSVSYGTSRELPAFQMARERILPRRVVGSIILPRTAFPRVCPERSATLPTRKSIPGLNHPGQGNSKSQSASSGTPEALPSAESMPGLLYRPSDAATSSSSEEASTTDSSGPSSKKVPPPAPMASDYLPEQLSERNPRYYGTTSSEDMAGYNPLRRAGSTPDVLAIPGESNDADDERKSSGSFSPWSEGGNLEQVCSSPHETDGAVSRYERSLEVSATKTRRLRPILPEEMTLAVADGDRDVCVAEDSESCSSSSTCP